MKAFMDEDFLLHSETAKTLYHQFAKDAPIYDYHCHLSPKEIFENKSYKNLTELWLGGDHYKWRIMRSNGITEDYITGDQPDYEKFLAFAKSVPHAIGNPMYHWTHLELQRYFGITKLLSEDTALEIWSEANTYLATPEFSARNLIQRSHVEVICTTDDPIDSLEYHQQLAMDKSFSTKVLPTFRPDKGINIDLGFFPIWLKELSKITGVEITNFHQFLQILTKRIDFFHSLGCRLSDHALDTVQYISPINNWVSMLDKANQIFQKALKGEILSTEEVTLYKSCMIHFLGKEYHKRGWVMQLHIGAMRNNSQRMFQKLGPDTGFDAIEDSVFAKALANLLDDLDGTNELPKTILYVLNPRDNYVIGTIIGNFQGGGIPGKIQFGSAWWFCDQKQGMIDQMTTLSNLGLLSRFVGMLTDSRSFLSYTRHEYFRRILCNLVGQWVEEGEYPNDMPFLGKLITNLSIDNARNYFNL